MHTDLEKEKKDIYWEKNFMKIKKSELIFAENTDQSVCSSQFRPDFVSDFLLKTKVNPKDY